MLANRRSFALCANDLEGKNANSIFSEVGRGLAPAASCDCNLKTAMSGFMFSSTNAKKHLLKDVYSPKVNEPEGKNPNRIFSEVGRGLAPAVLFILAINAAPAALCPFPARADLLLFADRLCIGFFVKSTKKVWKKAQFSLYFFPLSWYNEANDNKRKESVL